MLQGIPLVFYFSKQVLLINNKNEKNVKYTERKFVIRKDVGVKKANRKFKLFKFWITQDRQYFKYTDLGKCTIKFDFLVSVFVITILKYMDLNF